MTSGESMPQQPPQGQVTEQPGDAPANGGNLATQ
jgi:hypothetical protein